MPVTPALLRDHAIVYSAHFASYGALPATLYALPGAIAWLSVTWLDDAQLEQMHVSENLGVNNDFFVDAEIEVTTEAGERLTPIGLYTSRKGPLTHEGRPIRLAELPTAGTSLPALTQPAVLRYVHKRLGDDTPYSDFMHRVIADPEFRADVNARIAAFG